MNPVQLRMSLFSVELLRLPFHYISQISFWCYVVNKFWRSSVQQANAMIGTRLNYMKKVSFWHKQLWMTNSKDYEDKNVSVGNLVWKKRSDHSINKWNVLYWLYWKLTICKDVLCSNHGTIHDGNAKELNIVLFEMPESICRQI